MDQKISDSSITAVDQNNDGGGTNNITRIDKKEQIPTVETVKKKKKVVAVGSNDGKNKKKNAKNNNNNNNNKKKKVIVISAIAKDSTVVTTEGGAKGCRVQVSNTKKPLFFYLNVAKRYIKQNNYVELSALGMAIPTVVTISEILKKDGWATEKKIGTSTVTLKDETKGRVIMKAKIEILLERGKASAEKVVAKKDGSETDQGKEKENSEVDVAAAAAN